MRTDRRVWLGFAITVAVLGCGPGEESAGPSATARAGAAEAEGAATDGGALAPDFTLPDVDGREFTLSDYRGRTVVVDFWATWCPPCIFQVPELNKLWEAHRDAGDLAVIGVAVDVEGADVVGPWIREQGVEYTIVIGDEKLAREFGAMGFPTLAIINPAGQIESLHVGLIELEELESLVAVKAGT